MILKYLFEDEMYRNNVEEYTKNRSGETMRISYMTPEKQKFWTVTFETTSNRKEDAELLSRINDDIMVLFSPTTLTNEGAEYCNKELYPLVNKFERLLREFLYIKAALCDDERVKKVIVDLEEKDFGSISDILFFDNSYCRKVRDDLKNAKSRAEMLDVLDKYKENIVWDAMAEDGTLSTIRDNFKELKEYRNDVMHAHNIGFEKFKKAQKMYKEVNKELQEEIKRAIEEEIAPIISEKFASMLADRMAATNEGIELYARLDSLLSSDYVRKMLDDYDSQKARTMKKEDESD